jgi:hypothetical protein
VIETCHCRGQESVSDTIFAIEAPASMWSVHCIDDLLPYAPLIIIMSPVAIYFSVVMR